MHHHILDILKRRGHHRRVVAERPNAIYDRRCGQFRPEHMIVDVEQYLGLRGARQAEDLGHRGRVLGPPNDHDVRGADFLAAVPHLFDLHPRRRHAQVRGCLDMAQDPVDMTRGMRFTRNENDAACGQRRHR